MANSNRLISKATIPHTSHVPYNVEGPSHIAGIIAHAMCVTRIAMLAGTGNQVSSNRAMQYGAKYSHDQGDNIWPSGQLEQEKADTDNGSR